MKKRTWIRNLCMFIMALMVISMPVTTQAGTWKKNHVGWWWQEDNGSWPANGWKYIRGNWYAFDANGYMRYGWFWDGNNWYYLGGPEDGSMKTGWQLVNGTWYYMYGDGRMAANTWIGSYYVNHSGAWIENAVKNQWIASGSRWWYRHTDGSYTTNNWETINGKKYHFDSAGWMQTGWQKIDGNWYYLGPVGDGAMRTSQWVDGYYLKSEGKMAAECWVGDYYVGVSGKITKNKWINDFYVGEDGKKQKNKWIDDCYVGEDGKKKTSQWIGEYYVGTDGKIVKNQWIGDYFVGEKGTKVKETWIGDRYLGPDGKWDKTKPVPVPLEGIRIRQGFPPMKQGEENQYEWEYYPKDTTDDLTARWTSSDEAVASVVNGKVTAHKPGVAKITLKVGNFSQEIHILVLPQDESALSLEITYPTSGSSCLKYGEIAEASVIMQPGNISIGSFGDWYVDDDNVVVVNSPVGYLRSSGVGETTVYIKFRNMILSSQVKVVGEELEELIFDKTTLSLGKNEKDKIRLTSKPAQYAESYGMKWGSTDESVVTVDQSGNISARKPGMAIIYAQLIDKRVECAVTVTGEEDKIEYSYDTAFAKEIFDEINKLRVSNGVEPFVWNEEDAVRASKISAGITAQSELERNGDTILMNNEASDDVQMMYGNDKDFTVDLALEGLYKDTSCLTHLLKKTDQPLTGGCAVVVKKVDGKIARRVVIFTIGPSEAELANYSREERDAYWAKWMDISENDIGKYLF